MAIQLSSEQESRIQLLVEQGFRESPEKVLDAALAAAEMEAIGFEGTAEELKALLEEGLNSGEGVEFNEDYWNRKTAEFERMAAEHQAQKLAREA